MINFRKIIDSYVANNIDIGQGIKQIQLLEYLNQIKDVNNIFGKVSKSLMQDLQNVNTSIGKVAKKVDETQNALSILDDIYNNSDFGLLRDGDFTHLPFPSYKDEIFDKSTNMLTSFVDLIDKADPPPSIDKLDDVIDDFLLKKNIAPGAQSSFTPSYPLLSNLYSNPSFFKTNWMNQVLEGGKSESEQLSEREIQLQQKKEKKYQNKEKEIQLKREALTSVKGLKEQENLRKEIEKEEEKIRLEKQKEQVKEQAKVDDMNLFYVESKLPVPEELIDTDGTKDNAPYYAVDREETVAHASFRLPLPPDDYFNYATTAVDNNFFEICGEFKREPIGNINAMKKDGKKDDSWWQKPKMSFSDLVLPEKEVLNVVDVLYQPYYTMKPKTNIFAAFAATVPKPPPVAVVDTNAPLTSLQTRELFLNEIKVGKVLKKVNREEIEKSKQEALAAGLAREKANTEGRSALLQGISKGVKLRKVDSNINIHIQTEIGNVIGNIIQQKLKIQKQSEGEEDDDYEADKDWSRV